VSQTLQREFSEYNKAFALYSDGVYGAAQLMWRRLGALGDPTSRMMADRLDKGQPLAGGIWKWDTK